jgi:transmembrane protein 216
MAASRRVDASSLPLQMSFYFHKWYLPLFALTELGFFIFKGLTVAYPPRNLWPEIVLILVLLVVESLRLFLGTRGNLAQERLTLLFSLLVCIPSLFGYLYFLLWQTYVIHSQGLLSN